MATNHNLSRGLSPSVGSYISLGNSGRPVRVTERRGSPLPRWAATSVASGTSRAPKPRAYALLGDGSSSDKTYGWCLDTGATHDMTGRREFFTELDSDVRGSVKYGDASGVEIKGVSSVIFTAESGEHRLLTGVYYIPALRNSIISLG
jgi:hypothetical protein